MYYKLNELNKKNINTMKDDKLEIELLTKNLNEFKEKFDKLTVKMQDKEITLED